MSCHVRKPTLWPLRYVSTIPSQGDRVMISETENPQEAKNVYPGKLARHAQADLGGYFSQSPQCWFSSAMAQIFTTYIPSAEDWMMFSKSCGLSQ